MKKHFLRFVPISVVVSILTISVGSSTVFDAPSLSMSGMVRIVQAPQAPNSGISTNLSRNWSGYVADNGTYSGVTGTWIVPTVTASQSANADATWVGIGGMSGTDLIQAGTQTITQNGQLLYQAWYEVLPDASIPVSLTVKPGDSITTTLSNQGNNNWLITIEDDTTGQQYQTTVSYDSSESSAEWIEEMPSDQVGYISLDAFGSITFTQTTAVLNGVTENLTELGAQSLTMTNGAQTLSTPSAIGSDGESFTVTRTNASSEVAPRTLYLHSGGFTRRPRGDQGFSYASSTTESDGDGRQITRYIRYFVIPGGSSPTTTDQIDGSGDGFQYSFGNGALTVQWSF